MGNGEWEPDPEKVDCIGNYAILYCNTSPNHRWNLIVTTKINYNGYHNYNNNYYAYS